MKEIGFDVPDRNGFDSIVDTIETNKVVQGSSFLSKMVFERSFSRDLGLILLQFHDCSDVGEFVGEDKNSIHQH